MCIVGGVSRETQIKTMKETNCNILIATPGRLIDLVETENLTLEHVSTLVVDEADRMIDIGLVDQVKKIHEWCNRSDRHTVLLSASMAEKADFVDTIVTKPREELYLEADTVRDVHVGISSHINQAVRGVRDIRALVTFSYPSLTIILLECCEKLNSRFALEYITGTRLCHAQKDQKTHEIYSKNQQRRFREKKQDFNSNLLQHEKDGGFREHVFEETK